MLPGPRVEVLVEALASARDEARRRTAGGPNQIQTVDLSALADRSGVVRLDRLAALTASSDVVVGEVHDEELVLCRGLAGWPEELTPTGPPTSGHWPRRCGRCPSGPWNGSTLPRTRSSTPRTPLWLLDDNGSPAETNEPYRASAADIDDLAAQFLTRWG